MVFTRAKVVVIVEESLYSVFGQSGFIRAKVVVIVEESLYSGKSECSRAKWFYSGKNCCNRARLLHLGKVVVAGKSGCIRAKVVIIGQSVVKWLYWGGQMCFYSGNMDVFV